MRPALFDHPVLPGYALLDSGGARKLERFGEVILDRPDPQTLWRPGLDGASWERADLRFERESDRGGRWVARRGGHPLAQGAAPSWPVRVGQAVVAVRPTPFKHVGLFPEQATNWAWVAERRAALGPTEPALLNLFGYTGVASILAAQAGFRVTHVDASKASLDGLRENAQASGLDPRALRVVLEDASAFARREVRRGRKFAGILLDPPHYGRGPKGQKWQLETGLAPLLHDCRQLLAERSFLVLSSYAVGYSPLAFTNLLAELDGGEVEAGELAVPEEGGARMLPCGFCARWSRGLEAGS